MAKRENKYNANEVRITRCIMGILLFALIGVSIWGVRKLHLMTGFAIFISAPLLIVAAVLAGVSMHRQSKAGVDFAHRLWGMDYWFYVLLTAAISHGMLLVSLPVDWWVYTTPMAFVLVGAMYLLYVSGWDQGNSFKSFGVLSVIMGLGGMLNYQTYYNPVQSFIVFRFVDQQTAFIIGWLVLCAAVLGIWLYGRKKKVSVWKHLGVLLVGVLYWILLQQLEKYGVILTWGYEIALALFYVLLRVLRQIKIIS